ncbi:MAG: MarR family winged helix-turn-helix transcriptional regulator [Christensenellales bacterium]
MKKRKKSIVLKMGYVNHLVFKSSAKLMEEADLSRGMPPILEFLYEKGSCIQREIARQHHMNPASVTSALNTMEASGFIERKPTKTDKRAVMVSLTDLGREKYARLREIQDEMEKWCFAQFTQEQKACFEECLELIISALKKQEEEIEGKDRQAET